MKKRELRELLTVGDMVHYAEQRFTEAGIYYGHGTDNSWDEAAALVLQVLHLPPDADQSVTSETLNADQRERLLSLIERRVTERLPLPYLLHEAWFAGYSFYVDERVLIPRSPIAKLIERQFEPWVKGDEVARIADIGTGSGCIAIAAALAMPQAEVDAVDIDSDALEVARFNIAKHQLIGRVEPMQSDLFTQLDASRQYDIIIANPPYVDPATMADLPAEYQHEPARALSSPQIGLFHTYEILKHSGRYLRSDGILVVEVGDRQPLLEEAFPRVPFIWLEFEHGGEGVFLLTQEALALCHFDAVQSDNYGVEADNSR
ncbi:MAG: 50S ribosomal protein L3 N(5)-glutamine methyltransferase [Gammaproteobacteria bacterium]|nr:50S ribosomal protein L3 N(5)-glutamine methyltransferase [Gammaproteobacteria bacterium]